MSIHIKESHKGLLHKKLGVPKGEKIPASKLTVNKGDSPATVKQKVFAQNAKKWNHKEYGGLSKYLTGGTDAGVDAGTLGSTLSTVPNPYVQAIGGAMQLDNAVDKNLRTANGAKYKSAEGEFLQQGFGKASSINGLMKGQDVGRNILNVTGLGLPLEAVNYAAKKSGMKDGIWGKSDVEKGAEEKYDKDTLAQKQQGLMQGVNTYNTQRNSTKGNIGMSVAKFGGKLSKYPNGGTLLGDKNAIAQTDQQQEVLAELYKNNDYKGAAEAQREILGYELPQKNQGEKQTDYEMRLNKTFGNKLQEYTKLSPEEKAKRIPFKSLSQSNEAIIKADPNVQKQIYTKHNDFADTTNLLGAKYQVKAKGGTVENLSKDSVEFKGNSHEFGGIKEPVVKGQKMEGAEVEGNETAVKEPNNDVFVFSEELGFAQKHKPIAKAIGKAEKALQSNDNMYTRNTIQRLKQNEESLKVEQEKVKQQLGIPSDLDNKKFGGLNYSGGMLNKPEGESAIRHNGELIQSQEISKAYLEYGGVTSMGGRQFPYKKGGMFKKLDDGGNYPKKPNPYSLDESYGRYNDFKNSLDISRYRKVEPIEGVQTKSLSFQPTSLPNVDRPISKVSTNSLNSSKRQSGFGKALSSMKPYAGDIAGGLTGIAGNLENRALIAQQQDLLDKMPGQRLTPAFTPKLIKPNYNPAIRANRGFQLALDKNLSNPNVANANKLQAQANLYDSINKQQSDINTTNTGIENEALGRNLEITAKNNEISLNNYLRKLKGQDDIIRNKSTANAELVKTVGAATTQMGQRKLGMDQNKLDISLSDPRIQRHVALGNRKALRDMDFTDEEIDNMINGSNKKYGGKLMSKIKGC